MVGMTVFGALCGLAVNFPHVTLGNAGLLSVFLPTICVFLVFARLSRDRIGLGCLTFLGALLGAMAIPGIQFGGGVQGHILNYLLVAIPPAIGAMFIAWPAVMADLWTRSIHPSKPD